MNRGFKTYFKEGLLKSYNTFKKKGNYLRYYLYWIASMVGKMIPFVSSAFLLSDVRIARLAKNHEQIAVARSFESTDNRESIRTMIWTSVIVVLLFISGVLFIGVFGFLSYLLAQSIITASNSSAASILIFPAVILLLVFMILYPLFMAPASYIVDTNNEIGVSNVIFNSIDSMKRTGKWTYTLINIVGLLPGLLIFAGGIILFIILAQTSDIGFIIGSLLLFLFMALFLIVGPVFGMAGRIATVLLFEDIVLDDFNRTKNISGVNIQKVKYSKLNKNDKSQMLASQLVGLFDDVEEQTEVVEEQTEVVEQTEVAEETQEVEEETEVAEEQTEEVQETQEVEEQTEVAEETQEVEEQTEVAEETQEVEETEVEEQTEVVEEETQVVEEQTEVVEETQEVEEETEVAEETEVVEEETEVVETTEEVQETQEVEEETEVAEETQEVQEKEDKNQINEEELTMEYLEELFGEKIEE